MELVKHIESRFSTSEYDCISVSVPALQISGFVLRMRILVVVVGL